MKITADTLIPRPETELLVEQALARIPTDRTCDVVDMGTGSGAIALALASERPMARIVATDASPVALQVARENAERNRIGGVEFRHGDWYAPLLGCSFDLIVSNPPYIAHDDPHLAQGDLRFEPASALVSGADGLDALRTLSAQARAHLNPGGWIMLEHGYAQGAAVRDLLRDAGLHDAHTVRDLEHRERVSLGCAG
jgi:release factor glutamine methyltransferase